MTGLEAVKERRSIRKYEDRPLENDVLKRLQNEISRLNSESGLKMQLVTNERKAFKGFLSYGKFSGVSNYVMIIGRHSENLEYRAGYYGEKLVLYAQQLGLRTCWVGLTYKKIKGAFTIGADEKIVCCISIGYGAEEGHIHKSKSPAQVSNVTADTPIWFLNGVNAALLAPTAVNQQKFYFEYIPSTSSDNKDRVKPSRIFSMVGYTKIDLGIAMLHFEIGANPENFTWLESPF